MKSKKFLLTFLFVGASVVPLLAEDPVIFKKKTTVQTDASQEPMKKNEQVSPSLSVDIVISSDVVDRQPVGAAETFSLNTASLVGWTRIKGANQPTEITHVWSLNGEEKARVPLNVGSSAYRTWSRKNLHGLAGTWKLDVKDKDGNVLGSKSVEVTTSP